MRRKTATCPDVLKHICEELDHDINSRKCREIKAHLAKCPNCSAYLDSMKKTIRLYGRYPNPRVPKRTHKKLFSVLNLKVGP